MNLAIVGPYPPNITGISQYGYHVSQSLAASGQFERITVLADAPLTMQPPVDVATPITVEPVWQRSQRQAGLKIIQRLQTLKPDLVWFNLDVSAFGRSPLANLTGFLTPLAARQLGIPSVVTLHELIELADLHTLKAPGGPLAPYAARMMTHLATRTDVVCLTMRHYVDWLSAREPRLNCVHIPIGAYRVPKLLPEHDAPELLLFGMMSPFKGLETLLEAFRMLQAGPYPNLRLTIAGGVNARFPAYARRWQETIRTMDGVHWLGRVPEAELPALFERTQIVVLPYTASVGASSVLYQAATWGRAIVASDLPETQLLAQESALDVRFFERGDAQSLAAQLRIMLDSPGARRQQVQHNLTAMQRTNPEDICRAYLHAFNLALETCRSPKRLTISTLETV
jgi:glycosyltransferase involved in cell wall biosynthesis